MVKQLRIKRIPGLKRLPKWLFNKYLLVILVYGTYMLLFDSNHFRSQFRQASALRQLEKQKAFYVKQLEDVKAERSQLFSGPESIERFAREHYYMRREDETVYVFVEE
jgi:cell division protein DivIC